MATARNFEMMMISCM